MQKILFNNGGGWGTFKDTELGGKPFSMPFSYVTNVPVDALKAIIESRQNKTPLELYFDAEERGEWSVIAYDHQTVATVDSDAVCGFSKYYLETDKESLIKQIIKDIESDIDGWASFASEDIDDNRSVKTEIELLLQDIKKVPAYV